MWGPFAQGSSEQVVAKERDAADSGEDADQYTSEKEPQKMHEVEKVLELTIVATFRITLHPYRGISNERAKTRRYQPRVLR